MSLFAHMGVEGGAGSGSASAARVPLLSVSNGSGCASYAAWRPQMETFLMRAGIEKSDYAEEIPAWRELPAVRSSLAPKPACLVILRLLKPCIHNTH